MQHTIYDSEGLCLAAPQQNSDLEGAGSATSIAAVYGKGPANVYEFKGHEFRRWIVT